MERDSFVFYKSFYEAIKEIDEKNQLQVFVAICEYSLNEKEIELTGISKAIFTLIKPNIDSAKARYTASVENGKKGGRPKKETQQKPSKNLNKTQQKPSKNLNEDEDVNVDVDDNVNEDINTQKIHFAEFVSMTNAEYEKLISTHGKDFADQCISVLDNYKGASGKTYKSDYRAILNWVVDKVKEKKKNEKSKDFNYEQVTDEDLNYLYDN